MKLSNKKLIALAILLVGIIWCRAMFMVAGGFVPAMRCIGGVVCGLVAVALSILYLTLFRRSPGPQAAEAGAVTVYLPIAYAAASLASNTLLILTGRGGFNKFLMLWNLVISAAYILAILYAEKDAQRLAEQLARTEQKTAGPAAISAKLGEILGVTEDGEIRKQILKLKESVDYSSNITTAGTYESEQRLMEQLDELMDLIRSQGDASAIQSKLREAELTCKSRSSAAASRR